MKQSCYLEEYEGTRAKDLDKQILTCKTRGLVPATRNFRRRESTQREFTRPQIKNVEFLHKEKMLKYRVLPETGERREGLVSLFIFERRKSRRSVQAQGKIADERRHGGVPRSVESEIIHFFQSLIRRQFFKRHAVRRDKNAGAVIAVAAVHENFLLRIVAEKFEKLSGLLVGRR